MADLFEYLTWRGDLAFSQDLPNPVDALIFSALSYIRFGGSVSGSPDTPTPLREAADAFFQLEDHGDRVRVSSDLKLLEAAAKTRRFGDTQLLGYRDILEPEEETQFAALTFLLDDGSAFLAFRGTDYSLVGWKEDFNMSFQDTIPSQRLALAYTQEMSRRLCQPLRLGGHSKGGNLAMFAAIKAGPELRRHILGVYNNDGPGFREHITRDPAYREMIPRLHTYVPQSSVIGMLLEHEEPYTIIKSKQLGLLQHELYSWELSGPAFATKEEITADSRFLNQTIKNWLDSMSIDDRNEVVDAVFDLLSIGNVNNVFDILQPKNLQNYIRVLSSDSKLRKVLSEEFQNLMDAARKTQQQLDAGEEAE